MQRGQNTACRCRKLLIENRYICVTYAALQYRGLSPFSDLWLIAMFTTWPIDSLAVEAIASAILRRGPLRKMPSTLLLLCPLPIPCHRTAYFFLLPPGVYQPIVIASTSSLVHESHWKHPDLCPRQELWRFSPKIQPLQRE